MNIEQEPAVYTTGELAKFFGYDPRSISGLCDDKRPAKHIEHYKVPGTRDRRITHSTLLAYAEAHNITLPDEVLQLTLAKPKFVYLGKHHEATGWDDLSVLFASGTSSARHQLQKIDVCGAIVDGRNEGPTELSVGVAKLKRSGKPVLVIAKNDGEASIYQSAGADHILCADKLEAELLPLLKQMQEQVIPEATLALPH